MLRTTMRKKDHLPVIADAIRHSNIVSKETLAVARFDEKLAAFLDEKDNETADTVIDAAIAHATHGRASTVPAIKELLFSDDKAKESFREQTHSLLYPSMVRALWPSVIPDASAFPIDEALFSRMRKDSQKDFDAIASRFRARPPVPRPTDIFPKP
jgi:hypothetical protein